MLRVAAIQAESVPGDVGTNVRTAASWARRAARRGARVVVFAEAFTTGYDVDRFDAPGPRLDDLTWLAPLQEAVEEHAVVVLLGSVVEDGGRRHLATLLLRPGAPTSVVYVKQHLHPPEPSFFTAGSGGASVVVDGVELGVSICYDANFPEHAAAAARDGALVYVNSGAYFPGGERRRDLQLATRALDNGVYVVFSGLVGRPHGFVGGTAAFDPLGRVVDKVDTGEGMALVDVDPAVVAKARSDQRMHADRLPDLGVRSRVRVADPAS